MNLAGFFFGIITAVLGFGALIVALESAFKLSGFLLISAVFADWLRKILFSNSGKTFGRLLYGGWVIWFGGTVSVLLWKLFFHGYGIIGMATVFAFMMAALFWHSRNAKNEIENKEYKGLCIPAASGLIVTGIMWILKLGGDYSEYYRLMVVFVLMVSFFMITDIEYLNFRNLTAGRRGVMPVIAVGAAVVCGSILWPLYTLPVVFAVYMFSGLFREVRKKWIR